MVGAEGAALTDRASSCCASVHQQGHVPGGGCKQGCRQGAGKPPGPGLGTPLPGLADLFLHAGGSNSQSLAAFANGADPGQG